MAKRSAPDVNAGSMADIAFLLLIFFLVTTTIQSETGINRKLRPKFNVKTSYPIKERNVLAIEVNKFNQILVEGEETKLENIKEATIAFLDNGGGEGKDSCNYCKGSKNAELSVNPEKAVVSLKNSRKTNYETYVAITNEIVAAYNSLRDRESKRLFKIPFTELEQRYKDAPEDSNEKKELAKKIEKIKNLFPEKFSEAESDF